MKKIHVITLFLLVIFTSCSSVDAPTINTNSTVATEQKNISYGSNSKQIFDIYLPANRSSATTKTLILIHGGSWTGGNKEEMNEFVSIVKRNLPDYAIVNMNYRLSTSGNPAFPMQTDDIASVIAKLKTSDYQISNKIGFIGFSAGGHLSLLYSYAFNADNNIKMVASIVGPTNFTDSNYLTNGENSLFTQILGSTFANNPAIYRQNSPLFRATSTSPPTLLLYGNADFLVPITQGQDMNAKLNSLGVFNEFKLYNGGHGTWSAADLLNAEARLVNFIKTKF